MALPPVRWGWRGACGHWNTSRSDEEKPPPVGWDGWCCECEVYVRVDDVVTLEPLGDR